MFSNYLLENGEFKMKSGKIFKRGPLVSEVEVVPGHYRRRYKKVLDKEAMEKPKKQAEEARKKAEAEAKKKAEEEAKKKAAPKKKTARKKTETKKEQE